MEIERKYKKSLLNITKDNKDFYKDMLAFGQKQLVSGKVVEESDESITISYDIPEKYLSFSEVRSWTTQEKYRVIYKLIEETEKINSNIFVEVEPDNILIASNLDIKYIERKYTNYKEDNIDLYLSLLSYLFIDEEYSILKKLDRKIMSKNKYTKEFIYIKDLEAFKEQLDKTVVETIKNTNENEMLIKKTKYRRMILMQRIVKVFYVIFVITIFYGFFFKIPILKNQLEIVDLFQQEKYSEVTELAKDVNPKFLKNNIKYDIAVSTIKTEPLSDVQKEYLLTNMTLNTNEEIFDYWIYITQGEYESAKFKAQNIGNVDMQEYAVINQLEALELSKDSDEEKAQFKEEYESQINDLEKEKEDMKESEDADSTL